MPRRRFRPGHADPAEFDAGSHDEDLAGDLGYYDASNGNLKIAEATARVFITKIQP